MQHAQLSELERHVYRAVVDDGLLDLLLGIFLILFGLNLGGAGLREALPWVFIGLSPFVWRKLRTRLIEPRVGHVELHPFRRTRIRRGKRTAMAVVVFLLLAIVTVVVIEDTCPTSLSGILPIVVAALLGCPIAAAGARLEIRRWIGFGLLIVVAGVVEHVAGLAEGSSIVFSAVIVLAVGVFLLIRFTDRNPVMSLEAGLDA